MPSEYKVRQSVCTYLEIPAVRAGVDAILNAPSALPHDLEADEYASYVEALWSARQLQCEFALDLESLWTAIWGPQVPKAGLSLLSPGESRGLADGDTHPEAIWNSGDFVRYARPANGGEVSTMWVSLDELGASIGCSLPGDRRLEGLSEKQGYFNSPRSPLLSGGTIDLLPLIRVVSGL